MILFAGNDGSIIKSVPSNVYQGSANANNIYLIAPFAANLAVTVAFKLPNGVIIPPDAMSRTGEIEGIINEKTGKPYAGWQYALPNSITEYFGTVTAQFYYYSAEKGVVLASSSTSFAVDKGVPAVLPDTPSPDVYQAILNNLTELQQQLNNGAFAARAMYAWNSTYTYGAGEIVFYPEHGEYGVFVKSKVAENKSLPYVNGELNTEKWQLEVDFDKINEVLELQPVFEEALADAQAAAAAAKSSEESAAGSASAAQQSQESAAGSAAQAALSAEEAKATADRLSTLTDYISGVKDGAQSVPKAVSAETADKAINDSAGNNIAEQFGVVESDIEGLRSDINNEAHFRGMFESVEALREKYPTATENDFAYIVGGNMWIYQNGAWTNSGEPTPNTAVPGSDAVPLMDGVGSAGSLGAYARGDHRHPKDTSKADLSGATFTGMIIVNGKNEFGTSVYTQGDIGTQHGKVVAPTMSTDTINGQTKGNAILRQDPSSGRVVVGSYSQPLRLVGNTARPKYDSTDGSISSDRGAEMALMTDIPTQASQVDAVPLVHIGNTSNRVSYCMFARTSSTNPDGDTGATLLISGGGNYGGKHYGVWLVEITNRGSVPTMMVTTISANDSGTVTFGYRTNGSYFEFGVFASPWRAEATIAVLKNTNTEIGIFSYTDTSPAGWTETTDVKNLLTALYRHDITLTGTATDVEGQAVSAQFTHYSTSAAPITSKSDLVNALNAASTTFSYFACSGYNYISQSSHGVIFGVMTLGLNFGQAYVKITGVKVGASNSAGNVILSPSTITDRVIAVT